MVGSESAVCVAGDINYLFFNKDDSDAIDYWRVSEDERVPIATSIKGVSNGGAIAAVYSNKNKEIMLYFIGKNQKGGLYQLKELILKAADDIKSPQDWKSDHSQLTKKEFTIDGNSMLQATLDEDGEPRVFYKQDKQDRVCFAEYRVINAKRPERKDWTTTALTGIGA